ILESILCFLPTEEAVRTSILSKDWRYRWTKIPKLAFHDVKFHIPTNKAESSDGSESSDGAESSDGEQMLGQPSIIEIILCFLPIQEAVRTSILSREWRYRWIKIPKLEFQEFKFHVSTDGAETSNEAVDVEQITYPFSESKWSRPNQKGIGLYNSWYQSKSRRHLRSRQQLHAIQREIRRENEAHLGTCMRKISKDYKEMLKKKLEEIVLHNNTISPLHSSNISENKYKRYKCFHYKKRGHILKNCPTYNKSNRKNTDKDSSENTKESEEDAKPANPTVVLKYPESIHFSIKCIIKGTDHGTWDDIWYISNHIDKHLCYKQHFFCNIKEAFTVNKLDDQMKLLFTYGIGEVLIRDGGQGYLVPGVLVYMFNKSKKEKLDEDRLRTKQNQYLEEYFESLANKDILGLPKGNRENLKRCYIQYLDVFTSYYKNARAPQQEYKSILKMPTRKIEEGKDRDCLMSHQWNFGETCAPTSGQKGKGRLEHFGIKLEHTEDGKDDQPGHTNQNLQRMYIEPSTPRNSEKEVSSNDSKSKWSRPNQRGLTSITKSSPKLEKIEEGNSSSEEDNLLTKDDIRSFTLGDYSDIWLEHLSELHITSRLIFGSELNFVKLILAKSPVLKKVTIRLDYKKFDEDEELQILQVLLSSPRASPMVEIII
nr:ARID DNA-binding domain-containing protein [Tanacetum cinerariifolium]